MTKGHFSAGGRIALVAVFVCSTLATWFARPLRAVEVPLTLARSLRVATEGSARLDFSATHLAFSWSGSEGSGLRYRVDGSEDWRRATEAHDLESGDRHYSAVLVVDRPGALEWEPVLRKGAWIGDVKVDYMNTVDGPERTVLLPDVVDAAATTPRIVTRAEWGADESLKRTSGGCDRDFHPVQQLFVHHTAGRNNDPNPEATMRAIYHYHTQTRGWCDVGYNFVIAPDGTIYEGRWARGYDPWETHSSEDRRGRAVVGAHVADYNSGSVGISLMGNFSRAPLPKRARRSLVSLLAWEADRHDLDPRERYTYRNPDSGLTRRLKRISGHRDAGYTDCPGGSLYRALPSIRRSVANRIGAGRTSTEMQLSADPRRIDYGSGTNLVGQLTTESGQPLPAQSVTLYRRGGGRWRAAGSYTTGADGTFSAAATPTRNTRYRAVYAEAPGTWGSQSRRVKIDVKPLVQLTLTGGTNDVFGVRHYPPETTAVAMTGDVSPERSGDPVLVRVLSIDEFGKERVVKEGRRTLSSTSGFSFTFKGAEVGLSYRAVAWYERTRAYAASPSESVYFTVDRT